MRIWLLLCIAVPVFGDVVSRMDWFESRITLSIKTALEGPPKPSAHLQGLRKIERELEPELRELVGNLRWNRAGSIADLARDMRVMQKIWEELADSSERNWSRISLDGSWIEAEYSINLREALEAIELSGLDAGIGENRGLPSKPPEWTPVPADPWTGLIIYLPSVTTLWGTRTEVIPAKALFPRILSEDMEVLAYAEGRFTMPYIEMDSFRETEQLEKVESIVGFSPYRTMARGIYGKYDIVISRRDAQRLLAADSGRKALREGRIVVLYE